MRFSSFSALLAVAAALAGCAAPPAPPAPVASPSPAQVAPAAASLHDLVILGGRVIDPESGLDAPRSVGVSAGRIAAISETPLAGRDTIDTTGHVVAPGFIDMHAHGQDTVSSGFQALDGVTTALELEGGVFPVRRWLERREREGAIINYGASVSHSGARRAVMSGSASQSGGASGADRAAAASRPPELYSAADARQLQAIADSMTRGLDEGGIGFGFGINYTPGATPAEIEALFRAAAARRAPVFVHTRDFGLEPIYEVIGAAKRTGASLHIVHIGSSTTRHVSAALAAIDSARARGVDVTTEVYPYTAASTRLESAIFDEGWQSKLGISYGDVEVTTTGERLTAESFVRHRAQGAWVIIHMIPEETVTRALAHPGVIVASDGVPFVNGRAHPRGAGTFARVLGRYVREQGTLTLTDALARMTIVPAKRLQGTAPAFARKGRLQVGMDADITVFDPARVIDRATFAQPASGSAGIPYVLVNGVPVVRGGALVPGARPGRAVRSAR